MNRRSSFGRRLGWILLAACFLPVALRAEAQAPSTAGSPEPAIAEPDQHAPAPLRLTSIDATPGQDEVRVFLQTGGEVNAHPFVLDSPSRLVIDLEGVEAALPSNRVDVSSPVVTRVRVGARRQGDVPVTRVVFDLPEMRPYTVAAAPGGIVVTVGGDSASAAASAPAATSTTAGDAPTSETTSAAMGEGSPTQHDANTEAPAQAATAGTMEPHAQAQPATAGTKAPQAPAMAQASSSSHDSEPEPMAAPSRTVGGAHLAPAVAAQESNSYSAPRTPIEAGTTFETKTITPDATVYTGKKISLNLVDADIKQVFRLFHEISGLNFVLDPGVSGNVTLVLDEVPWDQALDLILKNNGLDKVYENNVIRIATTQKLASEASGRKALKDAKELEANLVGITRRLSYAKAKDIDTIIKTGTLLSSRGKSYFDERTNTLIVADVPTRVAPLDKLITDLDSKTPQVMIEARIVLTARDFLQDLGIQWGFTYSQTETGVNFPNSGDVTYALNLPRAASANRLGFNLFNSSGTFNLQLALDALETEGKSRVLSAPKIATQSNVRAEIEQGVQIPIANSTATEINVEFISASLKLTVTPQITAEDTVIMDITVENNRPSNTVVVGQIPGIDTQRATTRVMVEDGGTTVIGGIFQVQDVQSESGVPWLRKIPVLGWLFKSRNITTQNRELMIFITPKILRAE